MPLVSYHLDDVVATITMDDGKVNALSPAMQAEINKALDQAEADGAVGIETHGRVQGFSQVPDRPSADNDYALRGAGGGRQVVHDNQSLTAGIKPLAGNILSRREKKVPRAGSMW